MNRRGFLGLLAGVAAAPLCKGLGAAEIPAVQMGYCHPDPRVIVPDRYAVMQEVIADALKYGSGFYKDKPDGTIEHVDALSVFEKTPNTDTYDDLLNSMFDEVVVMDTGERKHSYLFDAEAPEIKPYMRIEMNHD